ncbi:monovalent cation/H+ antiporter complex subunit F [Arthrobacter sp. NPDC055585]|uniref:monovalent cation/H+ antiporter complex subunit F n=1 Tax=Arthrobacter koreensis TaxID=199136 RepID=UPI002DBBEEB2|nr:monovalent cation/H+ antiporter complex subunit F [Arthrobacter koreensis]MEB7504481.1 monovalent cation/H+ antiporter complex subunit F [Arthrobacter koreensis]
MTVAVIIVSVMLAVSAAGAIFRIVRGPSILDRVLAADVLLAIVGGALIVDMVVNRNLDYLALLIAISLIGFIGSVTVARFVTDRR